METQGSQTEGEQGASVPTKPTLQAGTMVDHYKVVRLLGRGGFGEVYLARDTKLGRKVALKLLTAEQFGSKEATKRFLYEARATAKFNHPNIVAIYGVGEFQENLYVALEYLEGQTLRERITTKAPTLRESLRIALSIAEALAEAHRRRVLHGDLKPENVLVPADGRLRLFDFGLATPIHAAGISGDSIPVMDTVESWDVASSSLDGLPDASASSGGMIYGTPEYMAPERWWQKEPSGATDIWSLGILLFELVVGKLPFTAPSLIALAIKVSGPGPPPEIPATCHLPTDLRRLITDCLRKEPKERPKSSEVVERLEGLVYRRRSFLTEGKSPFPGLLPFSERYADFFFGRESEVVAFLERFRRLAVLPVVGPSGAGKSSFVDAGLMSRIKEQGPWHVIRMRPGSRPFETLASRLLPRGSPTEPISVGSAESPKQAEVATDDATGSDTRARNAEEQELARRLYETPSLLGMMLHDLSLDKGSVLLFVDQLEELYALVDDPAVRRAFMEAICGAADDPQEPVRVIFTLRDDFLGRLAEGPVVREALSRLTVMRSPGPSAIREILTKPVEAVGYRYDDPKLVDEMITAVEGKPACLPLLQFATGLLWEHRDDRRRLLLRSKYEELGGVAGALADHADGVLEGLTTDQVTTARELLLRLVTPEGTRRILSRTEAVDGLGGEVDQILDRLIDARLVLSGKGREDEKAEAELELVHESLVWRWRKLARWLDEDREDLAYLADLSQAASLWEKRGCRVEEVWRGEALREAEHLIRRCAPRVPDQVMRFLQASREHEQRLARRKRLLQVGGVTLLVGIAVIAVVFATILAKKEREASRQKERAQLERGQARLRTAEAQREAARAALARDEPFEARGNLRAALEAQDSVSARVLWWKLTKTPLVWKKTLGAAVYDVAFSPDDKMVAAACQDKTIYLIDVQTHEMRFLRGHRDQVYTVAFSPDGKHLASGTWSGEVGLWEVKSGRLKTLRGHSSKVVSVAFSPDGRHLASSSYDKTVCLWQVPDGTRSHLLTGHGSRVFNVAFSPDGRRLASASWDRTVRIWDVATGASRHVLQGHDDRLFAVAFSPDGKRVASGGWDRTIRLWDAASGAALKVLRGHEATVYSVAFSPDGRRLASGSYDKTVRVWDTTSGEELQVLTGHSAWVLRVTFSPKRGLLASSSVDRTVRLWNLQHAVVEKVPVGHRDRVVGAAISPDGKVLATGGWDRTIRLWDLAKGNLMGVLTGHNAGVFSVAFSPDGKRLASGSWDKTVRIWNLADGTVDETREGHNGEISAVTFSPDGRLLASASWDKTIQIWDQQRDTTTLLAGHGSAIYDLAFRPDGRYLASGSADKTARIWDVAQARSVKVLAGHTGPVYGVSYNPDGSQLVSGSGDGTVRLWDPRSGDHRIVGRHGGRVYHLAFHPDGQRVGTPSADGTSRIWELGSGHFTPLGGHHAEVNFLRFSRDGRTAVTTSDDGTIRTWRVKTGMPFWRAPVLLRSPPRLFTHRGWLGLDDRASRWSPPDKSKWHRVLERRALYGRTSTDGRTLALVTSNNSLQVWDIVKDRLVFESAPGGGVRDPLVLPSGFVVALAGKRALLFNRTGGLKELSSSASSVAWDNQQVLVASQRRILVFDASGRQVTEHPTDVGVTAMAFTRKWLATGNEDGNIELIPRSPSVKKPTFSFAGVPASSVLRMLAGPRETLVVGYANGLVGLWNLKNGAQLIHDRLHGPVVHLHMEGGRLYAATALGDHVTHDLRALTKDYCALLKELWQEVDVVWERGLPVVRPPPGEHHCALR